MFDRRQWQMASASNGVSMATVIPAEVGQDDTGDGDFVIGEGVVISCLAHQ